MINLGERCVNFGLPRLLAGYNSYSQIVQAPGYVTIMAEMAHDARVIPVGSRAHLDKSVRSWNGDSIARWEGDTLVIESTSFNDSTWLGRGGFMHTADMKIVERLTRVGNELRYDMTVQDPMFVEPWVVPTRILRAGAANVVPERRDCEVYEEGEFVTQLRH